MPPRARMSSPRTAALGWSAVTWGSDRIDHGLSFARLVEADERFRLQPGGLGISDDFRRRQLVGGDPLLEDAGMVQRLLRVGHDFRTHGFNGGIEVRRLGLRMRNAGDGKEYRRYPGDQPAHLAPIDPDHRAVAAVS